MEHLLLFTMGSSPRQEGFLVNKTSPSSASLSSGVNLISNTGRFKPSPDDALLSEVGVKGISGRGMFPEIS